MKQLAAVAGMCFLIGASLGYIVGLADAVPERDILDCIELPYCPGLDEEPAEGGPWLNYQPQPEPKVIRT